MGRKDGLTAQLRHAQLAGAELQPALEQQAWEQRVRRRRAIALQVAVRLPREGAAKTLPASCARPRVKAVG